MTIIFEKALLILVRRSEKAQEAYGAAIFLHEKPK